MLKKTSSLWLKHVGLISFIIMICAAFILSLGVSPAQAAKKGEAEKAIVSQVDINSASQQELEGIKGVGAATAKKIIAGRPYKSVDELSKAGLSAKVVDAIKPFVTVGRAQAAPAAAAASKATGAATAQATEAQKAVGGLVDINSASQKELEVIKGVGPATAKKIIAGRPYKSVDELSKAGLSAKAVEAVKPFVTVGKAQAGAVQATAAADLTKAGKDAKATAKSTTAAAAKLAPGTKININTADQTTLEKLPEIGPVKAKAIIAGRPYNTPEDVMKVSGIKGKTFDAIKEYIVVK
jgi:competence protein ComEA